MVGEYVRSLRAAAGLNQRELARRVGVSPSMLSLVEAGRREPTIALLRQIARALDVPTAALFAIALADVDASSDRSTADRQLRTLTESLMSAVQRMLFVRRLDEIREEVGD